MKNETTTRTNAAGHEVRCASLFSQILSLIDRSEFAAAVQRTGAEKRTKGFSCWDQFVAMCFCQLAQAKSLREMRRDWLLRRSSAPSRHRGISGPFDAQLCQLCPPSLAVRGDIYSFLGRCQAPRPSRLPLKSNF